MVIFPPFFLCRSWIATLQQTYIQSMSSIHIRSVKHPVNSGLTELLHREQLRQQKHRTILSFWMLASQGVGRIGHAVKPVPVLPLQHCCLDTDWLKPPPDKRFTRGQSTVVTYNGCEAVFCA